MPMSESGAATNRRMPLQKRDKDLKEEKFLKYKEENEAELENYNRLQRRYGNKTLTEEEWKNLSDRKKAAARRSISARTVAEEEKMKAEAEARANGAVL